jgi:hypothetical protein
VAYKQFLLCVITGIGGCGLSGAFFESSALASDFTEIFFPLATKSSTLIKYKNLFTNPVQTCSTHVIYISLGWLTRRLCAAFFRHGGASVT